MEKVLVTGGSGFIAFIIFGAGYLYFDLKNLSNK